MEKMNAREREELHVIKGQIALIIAKSPNYWQFSSAEWENFAEIADRGGFHLDDIISSMEYRIETAESGAKHLS